MLRYQWCWGPRDSEGFPTCFIVFDTFSDAKREYAAEWEAKATADWLNERWRDYGVKDTENANIDTQAA